MNNAHKINSPVAGRNMKLRNVGWRAALAGVVLLAGSGCYSTHVTNGKAAASPSMQYDGAWHHGFVIGLVEVSGPYNLKEICPNGWAEIQTKTSFLNGLVNAVVGIYNPQTVTIRCAEGGAAPAAAEEAPKGEDSEAKPEAEGAAQ
jgi:hypothetical protein